jgi:hypothetical protein
VVDRDRRSIAELLAVIQELTANIADYPYEFIALDTIDLVIEWVEAFIMKKEGVTMIKDIPYGGGYSQVRERVMEIIDRLTRLNKKIILIGHRKKTSSSETDTNEFSVATLDISGKLKNFICADADAIGHVYRDEQGTLMVSFKPSDLVEAGARPAHLKAKTFPFQWEYIYVDTYKSEGYKEPDNLDVLGTTSTDAAA